MVLCTAFGAMPASKMKSKTTNSASHEQNKPITLRANFQDTNPRSLERVKRCAMYRHSRSPAWGRFRAHVGSGATVAPFRRAEESTGNHRYTL